MCWTIWLDRKVQNTRPLTRPPTHPSQSQSITKIIKCPMVSTEGGGGSIASRVKRKRRARRGVGAGLAALFGHRAAAAHAHASPPSASAAAASVPASTRTRADACFADQMEVGRAASRRRLVVDDDGDVSGCAASRPSLSPAPRTPPPPDRRRQRHINTIKSKLGRYQHHGTGNPLAMRSPSTPKTLAVDNLAAIIQSGHLGADRRDLSGSIPQLRTERGQVKSGAFWVNRVELAGHYGWTGLILQSNVDTSTSLPISKCIWFLVEDEEQRKYGSWWRMRNKESISRPW